MNNFREFQEKTIAELRSGSLTNTAAVAASPAAPQAKQNSVLSGFHPCKFADGKCIHCGDDKKRGCEGWEYGAPDDKDKRIAELEAALIESEDYARQEYLLREKAEAELAALRNQKPIAWQHHFEVDRPGMTILSYSSTSAGFPPRTDAVMIKPIYAAAGAQEKSE